MAQAIVSLREQLAAEGHECGAATIAYHLAWRFEQVPSVSTIWRVLRREGLVTPQPQKRPRSSLISFCAELPNEMWQADVTHWPLAGAGHAEILNMLDDHSRLFLGLAGLPDRQSGRRGRRLSHGGRPAWRAGVFALRQRRRLHGDPTWRQGASAGRAGRTHKGRAVKLLVADLDIRVLDADTGELIRQLTLDPSRDYQPIGVG